MLRNGGDNMGNDRQERKLKNSGRVESDRDQALHYPGATKLQSPEEARKLNDGKYSRQFE
jgi:hypothetical protein